MRVKNGYRSQGKRNQSEWGGAISERSKEEEILRPRGGREEWKRSCKANKNPFGDVNEMKQMKVNWARVVAAGVLAGFGGMAQAALVTVPFTILIEQSTDPLAIGSEMTGSYTFEDTIPNGCPSFAPHDGCYYQAINSITVGNRTFSPQESWLDVSNDSPSSIGPMDYYDADGTSTADGNREDFRLAVLQVPGGDAISSYAITALPNLGADYSAATSWQPFVDYNLDLNYDHYADIRYYGQLIAIGPITTVPLPAAVWFMVSGLLGLLGWGRSRAGT